MQKKYWIARQIRLRSTKRGYEKYYDTHRTKLNKRFEIIRMLR